MTAASEHVRPPIPARLAGAAEEQAHPHPAGVPEGPADLAIGAFSEAAPWVLTGERLPWQDGIDELRAQTGRQVPQLLRRELCLRGGAC